MSYDFFDHRMPSNNRFAQRLRILRSAAGLTPHALAQRAKVTHTQYLEYETGRVAITATALTRLLPALGVSAALFFDPD